MNSTDIALLAVLILAGFFLFLWLYFLPTLIIRKKKKRLFWGMLVANLFFGVTGLGWIICLIVALCVSPEPGPAIKAELL
jgi:phage shock protein PspC (stress-responsive transcriptional regulator)